MNHREEQHNWWIVLGVVLVAALFLSMCPPAKAKDEGRFPPDILLATSYKYEPTVEGAYIKWVVTVSYPHREDWRHTISMRDNYLKSINDLANYMKLVHKERLNAKKKGKKSAQSK